MQPQRSRRPVVGGNWKMHLRRADAEALATEIARGAENTRAEVMLFPAFVHIETVGRALREAGSPVVLGAQDCHPEPKGAFTGEVSLDMLADLGVRAVLAGHSERRHVIGESDEFVGKKARAALDAGMTCVLCVGETLEQREASETDAVNERQLRAALETASLPSPDHLVIAYEPVWAIGTGKTATPDDAQRAHAAIRRVLADLFGSPTAQAIRIQYGGSVKPANAAELFAQPDIDGGLIGGASLSAGDFLAIVQAAS